MKKILGILVAKLVSKKIVQIFGTLGLIAGIITDVLQPLAPFTSYLFFVSAILFVLLLFTYLFFKQLRIKIITSLTINIIILFFSGAFYILQNITNSKDKGILSNIKTVEDLQVNLGFIDKSLGEIKEDTTIIKEDTKIIKEETKIIVSKLESIEEKFKNLSNSDEIIINPNTPEDLYFNARLYELKGDYISARKAYIKYFNLKLDYIDPHLRFIKFLKIQEGLFGAKDFYLTLYNEDQRSLIEFLKIFFYKSSVRIQLLEKFISNNPDFAMAYYELSNEFSEKNLGIQSIHDKRRELAALTSFVKLIEDGKFVKFFIDQELANEIILDAKARLRLLATVSETIESDVVKATGVASNSGWILNLDITDYPIREVFAKMSIPWSPKIMGEIKLREGFVSLGFFDQRNPVTGLLYANRHMIFRCANFNEKNNTSSGCHKINTDIEVKYIDINNIERGPYIVKFDGKVILRKYCETIGENNRDLGCNF